MAKKTNDTSTNNEESKVKKPRKKKVTTKNNDDLHDDGIIHNCSFCGRPSTNVNYLVRGVQDENGYTPYICSDCAKQVNDMCENMYELINKIAEHTSVSDGVKTPHEIKEYLDKYVIGQDMAKMRLSVAVYNHFKRLANKVNSSLDTDDDNDDAIEIEKSNVLLVGDSGTGKTLLCKTLAKLMDVPFTIVDATVFTEAGYVGEDIETILTRALQAADGNVKLAERSIVYIDEFDKLARKGGANPSITRDVAGEGVQQGLLKMLEGSKVMVPLQGGRKHPDKPMVEVDTTNILFICGGAFEGLDRIISSRMNIRSIGYKNDVKEKVDNDKLLQYVTTEDLKNYGIIPEVLGRIPVVASLEKLTKEDMVRIITEPKNAIIKQFKRLFSMDGVQLEFEDDVYNFIVEKAMEKKLGARGLRSILENIMNSAMYDLPGKKKKVLVTLDYAKNEYNKYVGEAERVAL